MNHKINIMLCHEGFCDNKGAWTNNLADLFERRNYCYTIFLRHNWRSLVACSIIISCHSNDDHCAKLGTLPNRLQVPNMEKIKHSVHINCALWLSLFHNMLFMLPMLFLLRLLLKVFEQLFFTMECRTSLRPCKGLTGHIMLILQRGFSTILPRPSCHNERFKDSIAVTNIALLLVRCLHHLVAATLIINMKAVISKGSFEKQYWTSGAFDISQRTKLQRTKREQFRFSVHFFRPHLDGFAC
mmetsp:Transcript_27253/g.80335  ORF Transcript_27253/g.80335 Transcript_27253/m.80335 type:complete len:242 (+) Transcript_27253:1160-1885(+)